MTYSLIGLCPRTGQIGAAVATSSIAVGSRVPFCEAGVGAVLTQHRTDSRLGPRGLALLRSGCTAAETVAALVASTPERDAALDFPPRGGGVRSERHAASGMTAAALMATRASSGVR